jgi:hypothetical protein
MAVVGHQGAHHIAHQGFGCRRSHSSRNVIASRASLLALPSARIIPLSPSAASGHQHATPHVANMPRPQSHTSEHQHATRIQLFRTLTRHRHFYQAYRHAHAANLPHPTISIRPDERDATRSGLMVLRGGQHAARSRRPCLADLLSGPARERNHIKTHPRVSPATPLASFSPCFPDTQTPLAKPPTENPRPTPLSKTNGFAMPTTTARFPSMNHTSHSRYSISATPTLRLRTYASRRKSSPSQIGRGRS